MPCPAGRVPRPWLRRRRNTMQNPGRLAHDDRDGGPAILTFAFRACALTFLASSLQPLAPSPLSLTLASICPLMAPGDPDVNMRTLARWVGAAAEQGADLALFPETFITGYIGDVVDYWPADRKRAFIDLAQPVPGPIVQNLEKLASETGVHVCAGMLERDGEHCYNTQVLVRADTGFTGRYRKVQVAQREQWFSEPGDEFPVFDIGGITTGLMICRDKSFPEIARILALNGAQLLLNPHSTTACPDRDFVDWSIRLCTARAMENGCYLIANNNVVDIDREGSRSAGYTFAIDPWGEVIHRDTGPGDEEKLALVCVDSEVVARRRASEGGHFNLWSRTPGAYGRLIQEGDDPRYE
jgi:predicted amidohydrolase